MNLQLSMNLSFYIFTYFFIVLIDQSCQLDIDIEIKLMYFSLLSAMDPISYLLNFFPSSLMNRWAL